VCVIGTRAATFCALSVLSQQISNDGSADVYYVAKMYNERRPGVWPCIVSTVGIK
jgi:hypothetical protein